MPTGPKGSISSPRWSTRGLKKSAPGQGRLTRIYVEFLNRFSQMNVLFWRFECSDKTDTITNKHYNSKSIQTLRSGSFSTIRDQQRHQKTDFGRIFRTQAIWSFSGGGPMLLIATFRASNPVQDFIFFGNQWAETIVVSESCLKTIWVVGGWLIVF